MKKTKKVKKAKESKIINTVRDDAYRLHTHGVICRALQDDDFCAISIACDELTNIANKYEYYTEDRTDIDYMDIRDLFELKLQKMNEMFYEFKLRQKLIGELNLVSPTSKHDYKKIWEIRHRIEEISDN